MARVAGITTEKDVKDAEDDTFEREWAEAKKTGYTVKEAEAILIQHIRERWKERTSEINSVVKPKR